MVGTSNYIFAEPLDMMRSLVGAKVQINCRNKRRLLGVLHSFDVHLNMLLGPVIESRSHSKAAVETQELVESTETRELKLLFVRGDGVLTVSPSR